MFDIPLAEECAAWMVLALGAILVGLRGLLARRPAPAARRAAVAAGLVGLAGVALALEAPQTVAAALLALAAAQAVLAAAARPAVRAALGRAGAALAAPRAAALACLVAGVALAGWQVSRLDRSLEADLRDTDSMLAELGDQADLMPVSTEARTDTGRAVPLFSSRAEAPFAADKEGARVRDMHLEMHLIQTAAADPAYNCHGWVFTGGRHWLRGGEVDGVLRDNGYRAVAQPAVNDVAIFRNARGEVQHTALVRAVSAGGEVILESKWGQLGRYLHTDKRHAYQNHACTYYRSGRDGHVLSGASGYAAAVVR